MTKKVAIDVNPNIYRQFRVACMMLGIPCGAAMEEMMREKLKEWLEDNRILLAAQAKQMFGDVPEPVVEKPKTLGEIFAEDWPGKVPVGKVFTESM